MDEKDISPCTLAIANCLKNFEKTHSLEDPEQIIMDRQTAHFLTNMIQGQFLGYLTLRMSEYYGAKEQNNSNYGPAVGADEILDET